MTTDELRKRAEDARSRGASAIQVKWQHVLALLDQLDALRAVAEAAQAHRDYPFDAARGRALDGKLAALARHKEATK